MSRDSIPRSVFKREKVGARWSPAVQEASPNPEMEGWAEDDVEERGGESSVIRFRKDSVSLPLCSFASTTNQTTTAKTREMERVG